MRQRPGLDISLAQSFLNERMRTVLDRRPYWSGTLKTTVISIPTSYVAGTAQFTTGSPQVIGTGTAWPVSDAVNTTINEQVTQPGYHWVTPASSTGITLDTVLYIDSGGTQPEVCPVIQILGGRVKLQFAYPHLGGVTATASSLNGLQLRQNSTNPVFTVLSVTSPTTLLLTVPWGDVSSTGNAYQIIKMYTPIADDIKQLLVCCDPVQQIWLEVNVPQDRINLFDPNRTATDNPSQILNYGPNTNGSYLYEIYPPQSTQRQLYVMYSAQWPDMMLPDDMPPPFINPSIFIYGAMADAFSTPCPRPPNNQDPFMSMDNAMKYERMFESGVIDSMSADESLTQQAFQYNWAQLGPFGYGSQWMVQHDLDAVTGNF